MSHPSGSAGRAPLLAGKPWRFAFVVTRSDVIGGANVHVRDLGSCLQDEGHHVTVYAGGDGPFHRQLASRNLRSRSLRWLGRELNPVRDLAAARELRQALRHERPTILSLHTAKAGALGRLVAPSLGIRPLYTPHGWSFAQGAGRQAPWYRGLERLLARWPATIVNVCEHDRILALSRGVGRPEDHVVIHNGMPDVGPEGRANPATEPARLVMVARFEPQKDHATLLHALAQIGHRPPWTLTLVGDGSGVTAARHLAGQLGLLERITFTGAVDDVVPHLANAQVFVLTTRWEGFPRSILEAMRAGLPVVATGVDGVPESVADDRTGILVGRGDVDGLASALTRLLRDPACRLGLGAAGRRRFETEFTLPTMVERYRQLYRERYR